jgi:hypothetical protein
MRVGPIQPKRINDSNDMGRFVRKPPVETLAEMAATMTTQQIADEYGTTAKRARDWLARSGLKAQPMFGKGGRANRIEMIFGGREAAIAYIPQHDLIEAAKDCCVDLQVLYRWENYYGVRFKRTCRWCRKSLPYEQMRERAGGRIFHFCKDCFVDPNRPRILNYKTGHHERIQDEFADVPKWVSVSWGKPFGGIGWHNVAGIEMAKGWVME